MRYVSHLIVSLNAELRANLKRDKFHPYTHRVAQHRNPSSSIQTSIIHSLPLNPIALEKKILFQECVLT